MGFVTLLFLYKQVETSLHVTMIRDSESFWVYFLFRSEHKTASVGSWHWLLGLTWHSEEAWQQKGL